MIIIDNDYINTIPVLHVVDSNKQNQPLPTVVYMHGFTSAKEHNLPFAYLMAQKGFRVLLPDCKLHGERANQVSGLKLQLEFWDIVSQNLKEIQIIKENIENKGLLLDDRFGLAGTSMGGITTSAALTLYPWIKVAAVLMGSPKATEMANYTIHQVKEQKVKLPYTDEELQAQVDSLRPIDLSQNMHKLNNRPLLFWHGDADKVVPFEQSYSFYQEAKAFYDMEDKLKFIREKGRAHKVSRPAVLETVKWFETYL
ncbi:esterase [Salirhabdus sp. Marseille-P4669]|uniref:esterase n=1 Tax=Salirhabdus sp. Marseille-P4669 TaxID=2042310 RepID=UPI000C7C79CB|nr:esterase [Salirhabdus sp. Marseille-P4669]